MALVPSSPREPTGTRSASSSSVIRPNSTPSPPYVRRTKAPLASRPHVDDLAVLVDGSVDVAPHAVDLHVCLVDEPAVTGCVPGEPGGVGQQQGEPLHPAVDRHMVDLDAAFGEEFLDIPVGQPVAQVPAHRHNDHLGREAEPGERRAGRRPGTRPNCGRHRSTLPDARSVHATEPHEEMAGPASPTSPPPSLRCRPCSTPSPPSTTTGGTPLAPAQSHPATAYMARPKAGPGNRYTDTHDRLRHDRVDKSGKITLRHGGRLYSIGIGRTHARTHVLVLVQDLDIRIINATGETAARTRPRPRPALPTHRPTTRTHPENHQPLNQQSWVHGFPMSRDITHLPGGTPEPATRGAHRTAPARPDARRRPADQRR
jgi:hypothetical protein